MPVIPTRTRKGTPKQRSVSKAGGYVAGLYNAEGDLEAILEAFGYTETMACLNRLRQTNMSKRKTMWKRSDRLRKRLSGVFNFEFSEEEGE